MKNILNITNSGEQLISSIDDGTNQLIINDSVIPESQYIGSGTYTATISGHNITITKTTGNNIMLIRNSEYNYSLVDVPSVTNPVDWVTEQGTDNSWNYKKWHSGKYEAWRYYQATSLVITTASAGTYYGGERDIPFPSFHQSLEACTYGNTSSQGSGVYIYGAVANGSNLKVYYRAHASNSNASCGGFFYIHGTY